MIFRRLLDGDRKTRLVPLDRHEREAAAFARDAIGQWRIFDGLRRVLPALIRAGVETMPLKGILLAWTIYESPDQRHVSDADLLVRAKHFQRATAVLVKAGGRVLPRCGVQKHSIEFYAGGGGWTVDLHCDLWPPGFVELDLDDAWRHGSRWASPYGAALWAPPRRFTFAHVAAHFARNAFVAGDRACEDIARAASWVLSEHSPDQICSYLTRSGATDAAYYALTASLGHACDSSAGSILGRIAIPRSRAALLSRFARGLRLPPRLLRPLVSARRVSARNTAAFSRRERPGPTQQRNSVAWLTPAEPED